MISPIATPATGARNGTPASIIDDVPPDRGHRRSAVRLEDVRHDGTWCTGILPPPAAPAGRALGERSVPFRGGQAAHELHFPDPQRRSCIQRGPAVNLALDRFDLLLSSDVPSITRDERWVSPRVDTDGHRRAAARRLPDRSGRISSNLRPSDARVARGFPRAGLFPSASLRCAWLRPCAALRPRDRPDEVGEHLIDGAVVLQLVLDAHHVTERIVDLFSTSRSTRRRISFSRPCASPCRLPSRARRSSRRCA